MVCQQSFPIDLRNASKLPRLPRQNFFVNNGDTAAKWQKHLSLGSSFSSDFVVSLVVFEVKHMCQLRFNIVFVSGSSQVRAGLIFFD